MTISNFYNNRHIIESFGRSKAFETCRKLRDLWPGFPQYEKQANEFICAWLIYIMAKTGNTTTSNAVAKAIHSAKKIKSGEELFIVWLGNVLLRPENIERKNISIWVFENADFIQVNLGTEIRIFQGDEKVKSVCRATNISAQFLLEFSQEMKRTLIDESAKESIVNGSSEVEF